jgi:sulfhydrogenase subunit delta
MRPKVGIFSLSSCQGCQFEMMNIENIMKIFEELDIVHCKALKEENKEGPFDIAIVEGGILTKEESEEIKQIRKDSKFLIALGACADIGCVMGMRKYVPEAKKIVYDDKLKMDNLIEATGIDKHVKVDYYLHGCPFDRGEFVRVVMELLHEKTPRQLEYPVCFDCRIRENDCVFEKGRVCMGPVSHGGCGAICVTEGDICHGCRGMWEDANIEAHVKLLENSGATQEEIRRMYRKYFSTNPNADKVTK